ncbi:hypothetical protein J6590_024130 [Homalodisca vitripennis]|nr:hypothetical protein J6590_024130 [Homalodisca vitripennis]
MFIGQGSPRRHQINLIIAQIYNRYKTVEPTHVQCCTGRVMSVSLPIDVYRVCGVLALGWV